MKNALIVLLVIALIGVSIFGWHYYQQYNTVLESLQAAYYTNLSIMGAETDRTVQWKQAEGKWWLEADDAIRWIDSDMYFSGSGKRVYIPYANTAFRMETRELDTLVNQHMDTLNIPLKIDEDGKWIEMRLLERLYGIRHDYYPATGVHGLQLREGGNRSLTTRGGRLMSETGFSTGHVEAGVAGRLLADDGGRQQVLLTNGLVGWMEAEAVALGQEAVPEITQLRPLKVKQAVGNNIRLVWQQVSDYGTNPDLMEKPLESGINVYSPTWFNLNVEGIVLNIAAQEVVDASREQGVQIWPIFKNNFDPDWTKEMLNSKALRGRVQAQLLVYSALYDIDGINFDFENMYLEDKAAFAAFIEETAGLLSDQGMTTSVDVTVPWGSDMWSKVYDRPALAEAVDYVMLMAYDEHWASSQKPGSVASEPWVRKGIEKSLELIPREKLVLGIPFYSRIWSTATNGKVSSKAVGFKTQEGLLESRGLKTTYDSSTGQNVVVYKEQGATKEIWLEDETSVRMRVALAKEYDLPGIAAWSRAFADQKVWDWIVEESEEE